MDSSLPTAKVNLIASKMDIFVREDLGDLLEELFQKLVNALLRRVHWSLQPIFFTSGVVAPGFVKRNCVQVDYICICWTHSVSRPGCPGSKDWVCPGVSNSATTRIPRRRAYLRISCPPRASGTHQFVKKENKEGIKNEINTTINS